MQNVSQPRPGQSLFAVGLRLALGVLCASASLNLLASQSAPGGTANDAAVQSGAQVADENRRPAETDPRRLEGDIPSDGRDGAVLNDGGLPTSKGDRSGLRRTLTDTNKPGAVIQRTEMSREERRALRRELRDAMQGANEGRLVAPPSAGPSVQ